MISYIHVGMLLTDLIWNIFVLGGTVWMITKYNLSWWFLLIALIFMRGV